MIYKTSKKRLLQARKRKQIKEQNDDYEYLLQIVKELRILKDLRQRANKTLLREE